MSDRQATEDRNPRIVMVIDNLEPGGAQRQLCLLATSLRRRGYTVTVFIFRPDFFLDDILRKWEIPIVYIKSRNRLHLIFLMRREICRSRPDVVIGFCHLPNLVVELSGLPRRRFAMIVSERSLDVSNGTESLIRYKIKRIIRYYFHRFADFIVCNSHTQGAIVERVMGSKTSTKVIVNGVDTGQFRPSYKPDNDRVGKLRLLVAARISPEKNVLRLICAVHLVTERHPEIGVNVDWYGHVPVFNNQNGATWEKGGNDQLAAYFRHAEECIERHSLRDVFRIHRPQKDARELYVRSDVMCLPSLYEGCSNVIAEAMACGLPVLASRVGDNTRLVEDGRNGFLFNPLSVEDIAGAIVRFSKLPIAERQAQGREGRKMAEELLSVDTLADRYVNLIGEVMGKRTSGN